MKLKDLLSGINILEMTADPEMEIGNIAYDSRSVKAGDLFVAIVGYAADGHRFIPAAAANGAAAVLCTVKPEMDIPYVLTDNTRLALALASANLFGRPSEKMKMIGVTGTNGKTTSTLLIKHILETAAGAKVGLIGTNGNMIGDEELETERTTPESYELQKLFAEMSEKGCSHVVMEVSSHAITLDRVAGINFDVALFTNLTQDHLDFHADMDEYAGEKAKLFTRASKGVINMDDDYSSVMLDTANCEKFTFSLQDNAADLVAKDVKLFPSSVKFCAVRVGDIARVSLGIPGRFTVYNALGAIACCMQMGLSLSQCAEALLSAKGVKGRVEAVPTDGDYTILIDYSHTPDALENVLNMVRETSAGRVVALFGCGGDRDAGKRPKMGKIGTELADFSIITSDNPRTEDPEAIIADIVAGISAKKSKYTVICDRVEAIEYAIMNHRPGDTIVLAGKGHETYQEINHVKHHMDEREIVAAIIEKRKNK